MATKKAATKSKGTKSKATKTRATGAKKPGPKKGAAKAKSTATKRPPAAKRTLVEPKKGDKRYVRRNPKGEFKEVDDVSLSLSRDKIRKAKKSAPKGQKDKGD